MKNLAEERVRQLAESKNWSPEYASGFVDGETQRRRQLAPSSSILVGIDAYSLGFRAGYFERKAAQRRAASGPLVPVQEYPQVA